MEDPTLLTTLCTAMFLGSYLAGSVPLFFSMSQSRIRMFSMFGAGLLIGTALCVIIPEGVQSLYNNDVNEHNAVILDKTSMEQPPAPRVIPRDVQLDHNLQAAVVEEGARVKREAQLQEHGHDTVHKAIGLSLTVGFLMMLVIDHASRCKAGALKSTATIGLVVHSAADGVALGSASAIHRNDVQLIVFLALMLHKAPAAFGLVSFLLLEGLERNRIKRHLFLFSFAAPFSALLTSFIIYAMGNTQLSSYISTGVLMLFSAGTFLYVSAVHVIPELVNTRDEHYQLVDSRSTSTNSSLSLTELTLIISGALLPALLASGHSH